MYIKYTPKNRIKFLTQEELNLYLEHNKDFLYKYKVIEEIDKNDKIIDRRLCEYPDINEILEAILDGNIIDLQKERDEVKNKYPLERTKEEQEEAYWRRLRYIRNLYLKETDWTTLADAPLSNEAKKDIREYRQYLRDYPEVHKNKQTTKDYIMKFEEWMEDKPIYKAKKKVLF